MLLIAVVMGKNPYLIHLARRPSPLIFCIFQRSRAYPAMVLPNQSANFYQSFEPFETRRATPFGGLYQVFSRFFGRTLQEI